MSDITVVAEENGYRLIHDGHGRFAVVAMRGGRVYSDDPWDRREAEDTPAGMASVVGAASWWSRERAELRFRDLAHGGGTETVR